MHTVDGTTAELTALEALHEIALVAADGANEPAVVARLAAEHACRLLHVEAAAVFEWDARRQLLVPIYETPSDRAELPVRRGEGMVGQTFETNAPVTVDNYQEFDGAIPSSRGRGMGGAVSVPMVVVGRTIGVLGVWAYSPRSFTDAEVRLLSLFASHVAPTIVGARIVAGRGRRQEILGAMHEIAVTADPDAVAQLACERTCEMLGAQAAYVLWYEADAGHLRCVACSGDVLRPPGWTTRPGEGISGIAFTKRTTVSVGDYSAWDGALDWAREGGVRSMTSVPLMVRGEALGAMVVSWHEPHELTADESDALVLVASQVGADLEGARLREESARQVRALRALHDVSLKSAGVLDREALARLAIDRACELLGADAAVLRWFDPETGALLLVAANDERVARGRHAIPADAGAVGIAFTRGETVVLDGYAEAPDALPEARHEGVQSAVAVPFIVGDRPTGALAAVCFRDHAYSQDDVRLLELLAAQLAPALEAARLADERERNVRTLAALERFASASAGVLDPTRLATLAVEAASTLLGGGTPVLGAWDEDAAEMRIMSRRGSFGYRVREGAIINTFRAGTPVIVEDYMTYDGADPQWQEFGVRAFIGVPLAAGDRTLGALAVAFMEPHAFAAGDVQALQLLAGQVGPAIGAAELHADLVRSEGLLRGIHSTMGSGLVVIDGETEQVIDANDAALRLLRLDRNQLDGRLPADIAGYQRLNSDGEPLRFHERPVARALRTCRPVHNAIVGYRSGDGAVFWLQHDAVPLVGQDGTVDRVIDSFIDVTDVREAEVARRENEAKTRFLASMSHELRTPLNSILGFGQLLAQETFGPLNERQRRYLGHIDTSGHHLLDLVNDILDLSKVAAGQMEVHVGTVSLAEVVEGVLARMRPQVDAKKLEVDVAVPSRLAVRADHRRLEQVVENLVANAVKFTPEGGRIGIDARRRAAEVVVSVRDTGIGIPPEQHRRIFDEFTQVDDGRNRRHEGTGLGLPLSKRLLELMGGRIWVRSAAGAGSAFTFAIPAAQ